MFKLITSILLTAGFIFALKLYFERDTKSLLQTFEDERQVKPSLILEDFTYRRYLNARLEVKAQGRLGQFMEPNVGEVFGDFKLQQRRGNEFHRMSSESAVVLYHSDGLGSMMSGAQLDRVTLKEFVTIHVRDNIMKTDKAIYTAKNHEINSSSPVEVRGTNRWFKSEEGFRVQLNSEMADFYGKTHGQVIRNKEE